MECEYCEILSRKGKAEVIYEDAEVAVVVKDLAITPGQITVFPKQHFTIMEQVPDSVLEKCSLLANKVSMAVFDSLGSQGTNILVQNGLGAGQKVPHFALEVVPRREGDNLNLQWAPKQIPEDEFDIAYLQLKEEGNKVVNVGKSKEKKEDSPAKKAEPGKIVKDDKKDNYLLKSLRKIP